MTTLLARRAQYHQAILSERVTPWSPETAARLQQWADQFAHQGADSFTAARRATGMLYRELVEQAQILSYADEFWLLALVFTAVLPLLPLLRRVRAEENERARATAPSGRAAPVPDAID